MKGQTAAAAAMLLFIGCAPGPDSAGGKVVDEAPPGFADVYRDRYGVPHIYSVREEDGYFALGYVQAEDRMTATLAAILAVQGRSASVYGQGDLPWGGKALQADREALRWRLEEESREGFERLPQRLQRQLRAHAAGFRAYQEAHPDKIPAWAPHVEPWHALAWPQLLLLSFNVGDGFRECAAAGVRMASGAPLRFASNVWAVAPSRTELGRTIVLSDPHGPIPAQGNPFYEYRMKSGELDVTGFALGALPALVHSAHIAFGLTTGGPDVSDCYRLTLDPDAEGRYRIHGQWRQFERRDVDISVKDSETLSIMLEEALINGYRAPVVARDETHAYAVVTSYTGALETLHVQFDTMIRATNADGVLDAARIQGMFPQNLLIADSEGTIIYLRGGRTPVRSAGLDWSSVVSGDDQDTRWAGVHPVDDLVMVRNPPTGYLQNNNTPPDNMVANTPLVRAENYPEYIWNDNPQLAFFSRAGRANAVLDGDTRLSLDDAAKLALDDYWFGTETWTALLATAVEHHSDSLRDDTDALRVLERLLEFDGHASADSQAALAHYFWRTALVDTFRGEAQSDFLTAVANGTPSDAILEAALKAVGTATESMRAKLGSVDHVYGDWFRLGRSPDRHYPVGGGVSLEMSNYAACRDLQKPAFACALTSRAFAYRYETDDGRPLVSDGSRALRLVMLGEPVVSMSLYNFGQSDDAKSPHWDDQARKLGSKGRLKRIPHAASELAMEISSYRRLQTGL